MPDQSGKLASCDHCAVREACGAAAPTAPPTTSIDTNANPILYFTQPPRYSCFVGF
jgi:hypothetical protein